MPSPLLPKGKDEGDDRYNLILCLRSNKSLNLLMLKHDLFTCRSASQIEICSFTSLQRVQALLSKQWHEELEPC